MDPRVKAVLEWINSFDVVEQNVEDYQDLCDGIVLMKVLIKVHHYFEILDNVINKENVTNWEVRASNLEKIKLALDSFYSEYLRKGFKVQDDMDTNAIAKGRGLEDFLVLMELVCGAAAMCSNSEIYDDRINVLSESSKSYIQELRENSFVNTYDLIKEIEDISDVSSSSNGSEHNIDETFDEDHWPGPSDSRQIPNSDNCLLTKYMHARAALEIQKRIAHEASVEIIRLKETVKELSATIMSLQSEASKNSMREVKQQEELCFIKSENESLKDTVATLTSDLDSAKTRCKNLDQSMSSLEKEVIATQESNSDLVQAEELVKEYKHKVECLTPLLTINEDLELRLKDTQTELEEVTLGISARFRLENEIRSKEVELLKGKNAELTLSCSSQEDEIKRLMEENKVLKDDLQKSKTLSSDNEKLQDNLSLQYIRNMKLEQELASHQKIFRQYKSLIKDTYQIIGDLRSKNSKAQASSPKVDS